MARCNMSPSQESKNETIIIRGVEEVSTLTFVDDVAAGGLPGVTSVSSVVVIRGFLC